MLSSLSHRPLPPGSLVQHNLHAYLARTGIPGGLTVATATDDNTNDSADDRAAGTSGPAGPVWRVAGHPGRVALADIPVPAPPSPVDGEAWDG